MSSTFDIQMLKVRDVNDNNFFATSFQTGIRLTYYFYVIFIYYVMKKLILKQKKYTIWKFFSSNPHKQTILVIKTGENVYAKKTENK